MKLIDRYLERRGFVRVEPVKKTAGFLALETPTYAQKVPDQSYIWSYEDFIRAYKQLPWLYAGALAVAVAATKPALKIYRETGENKTIRQDEVQGEPINALVEVPNPDWSYREMVQIEVLNLILTGNHYENLIGTKKTNGPIEIGLSNQPVERWWMKPNQVFPHVDALGALEKYEFRSVSGQSRFLTPSEVIHFRLPNPGSYYLGMGMMEPAMNTATMELDAMSFQRRFMENDAVPPLIFTHPSTPGEAERKKFLAEWKQNHGGAKNAGKAAMVWGGFEIEKLGQTMKDAQYTELRKQNREELLATIGVPPSIVGLLEYANYSNMEVQSKKFWQDTVIPILGVIADKLTLRLAPMFNEDYWFEYDFSDIDVLQEDGERKARIAETLIRSGVKSPNEVREEMYNAEPYVGGSIYYMPMGLVPVGGDDMPEPEPEPQPIPPQLQPGNDDDIEAPDQNEPEPKPKPEKTKSVRSFWREETRKKALWEHFEKRMSASERRFLPLAEKYLHQQNTHVRRRLEKAESMETLRVGDVFNIEDEVKLYAEKHTQYYIDSFSRAMAAGLNATKGLIDDVEEKAGPIQLTPEQIERLTRDIAASAHFFNDTTWSTLSADIEAARLAGKTIEELTQQIWEHLESMTTTRARLIARTEMSRVENGGQVAGYGKNEHVDRKGWLCMQISTSREDHIAADGQEVLLNDPFLVGGESLQYPGASGASAGNVCNCLCTTYPVVGGE